MLDRDLLVRIERAGVHAWPASDVVERDGWLWRFSHGGSQRANSVSALSYSGRDVDAAIDAVEAHYGARKVPAMFQVSDVSEPDDLDQRLAQRGYRINDGCVTLVKAIEPSAEMPLGTIYFDCAASDWFACYASVITPARRRTAPQILQRIPQPRAFCGVVREGRIAATALAVANDDIVIAECVATLAEVRGTGAASAVMRGLEAWGAAQGCRLAALQAVETNLPAQALYRRLGYCVHGRYHMRVKD